MKIIKKYKALILVATIIFLFVVFKSISFLNKNSYYTAIKPIAIHSNGMGFAGSAQCIECHKDIYDSHIKTAHFKSSAIANVDNIKGSFDLNKNRFLLNEDIHFMMAERADGFYQDAYSSKKGLIDSKRLDITIGSGTKGQTYLNWHSDSLFQLQVSYFKATDSWANSPGHSFQYSSKQRPILSRCLECHTTFAKNTESLLEMNTNTYDKSQIIYGIDCERCHGPALNHVNFHKENPTIKVPTHIKQYSNLNKQQRLHACALCHSGIQKTNFNTPFEFIIGDKLNQYPISNLNKEDVKKLDVHGNQYGLMYSSKCFKISKTMDCSTCHDVHKNERGNTPVFNNRCMSCHKNQDITDCSLEASQTKMNNDNCINCHMPLIASKAMFIETKKDSIPNKVKLRSHFIGIYEDGDIN